MEKKFESIQVSDQFAKQVLEIAKARLDDSVKAKGTDERAFDKGDNVVVRNTKLSAYLRNLYKIDDIEVNTYYKELHASDPQEGKHRQPKEIRTDRKPAKTLMVLLLFLDKQAQIDKLPSVIELVELIKSLYHKGALPIKETREQLALMGENNFQPVTWTHYFVCYFSLGAREPDAALLKVDVAQQKVEMIFEERGYRRSSVHNGTIKQKVNIFIEMIHEGRGIPSLISLKAERASGSIEDTERLEGFYCSALDYDTNGPVAGKVILVRALNEEEAQKQVNRGGAALIPDNVYPVLYNQRLVCKQGFVNNENNTVTPFQGIYKAYWYVVAEDSQEIREIRIEVMANGTAKITDVDMMTENGFATQTEKNILRLNFDYSEERGYRLHLAIDVTNNKAQCFDGVYSGLRYKHEELMAGKIRLYRTDKSFKETDVQSYPFERYPPKELSKGRELVKFFWGQEKKDASQNFIQPTFRTFEKYFLNSEVASAVDSKIEEWSGDFCMYRLDSRKKRINLYWLVLSSDGTVEYSLRESQKKLISYSGSASVIGNCLVFNIKKKNEKTHTGLYIFWIGGEERDLDAQYLSGVYSTLSAANGSPLCGRVVLIPEHTSREVMPITFEEDEFYKEDERTYGLMRFLTGRENNIIEGPRVINKIEREIDYSKVFFAYACSVAALRKECLRSLVFALDHGYSTIDELKRELTGGKLAPVVNYVKFDSIDSKKVQISIHLEDSRPAVIKKVRFNNDE